MSYILYSPAHDVVREAFNRPDGTFVPEKVFTTEARALYRLRGLPDRRYRSSYPVPADKDMYLAKFRSVKEAIRERETLADYCGEEFEIREWLGDVLGAKIEVVTKEIEEGMEK